MAKCAVCGKFVAAKGLAACNYCKNKYHLAYAHLKESPKANSEWRCLDCRKSAPVNNSLTTPVEKFNNGDCRGTPCSSGTNASFEDAAALEDFSQQQEISLPVKVDLGQEIRLFRNELQQMKDELKSELREIRREVSDLRQTVTTCSKRVDSLESRIELLESRQVGATSEGLQCKLEETVAQLKVELNDREQELLSSDLEIANLPEESGENVIHIVELVARKLGVMLETRDIVFAERVGPVPERKGGNGNTGIADGTGAAEGAGGDRVRRIVVRLARRGLRDELLKSARTRRGATSADFSIAATSRRFYLNERLSRSNKQLFYRARQAAQRLGWRYTWTKRGRILTKQGDGKRTFNIRSEADLERVFGSDSVKDNIN